MTDPYRDLLLHAYEEELDASSFYMSLSSSAPTPLCQNLFWSAANDEYRHAQMLAVLLSATAWPGSVAVPSTAIGKDDLEKAIQGELEAICDYAKLASLAHSEHDRLVFLSILGDEYGHVRIFLALQSTGCV